MSEETTTQEVTTEVESYGIVESKQVLKFGISIGEAIDLSLENDKIGLEDAMNFYDAVLAAGPAFDNIAMVPKELGDLDQGERDELLAYAKDEFDISDDKLEAVVEEALTTALQVYKLVETVKKMKA